MSEATIVDRQRPHIKRNWRASAEKGVNNAIKIGVFAPKYSIIINNIIVSKS
jgi:hypothetical protein